MDPTPDPAPMDHPIDPANARRRYALGPRRFALVRNRDVTGVSGTGHVADGICWRDGTVTVRWLGEHPSTVVWPSMASVRHVHGHGGATRVDWLDSDAWVEGLDEDLCGVRRRAGNVAQDYAEGVRGGQYLRDLEESQVDVGWLLEEVARLRRVLAVPVPEQPPTAQDYGRLCTAYGTARARSDYLSQALESVLAELERVCPELTRVLGPDNPAAVRALTAVSNLRSDTTGTSEDNATVTSVCEIGRGEAERLVRAAGLDPEEVLEP